MTATTLENAISLHREGRLEDAERVYRSVLVGEPRNTAALHLLGVIRHQQGRHDEALGLIGRAIAANPTKAVYHNNYGAALLSLERFAEAAASFHAALKICPRYPDALANLGLAISACEEAENRPSPPAPLPEGEGRTPPSPPAPLPEGEGRTTPSPPAPLPVVEGRTTPLPPAPLPVGEGSEACYRQALAIDPRHRDARKRLAALLDNLARLNEAVSVLESACAAFPGAAAFADLGDLYLKAARAHDAQGVYRKAIELDPNHAAAHFNLGLALDALHDTAGAQRHYARAAELRPDRAWWRLRAEICGPAVFESTEEIEEYCTRVEGAIWSAGACHRFSEHTSLALTMEPAQSKSGDKSPHSIADILEAGVFPGLTLSYLGRNPRRLKERFAALFQPFFGDVGQVSNLPDKREIGNPPHRIGFVVTRRHEGIFVGCMAGVLRHLDPERFEPVILCSRASVDLLKKRLANERLHYRAFSDDFRDGVRQVREAACDLLYYWEVGSDAMNYFLPFARLAAVQCTGWGTTISSGVPAVDWFISSELFEYAGSESQYSERLWQARSLLRYEDRLAPRPPAKRGDFGLPEGRRLYVCFQNPLKLHPDFDSLLAGILAADSHALIVLLGDRGGQVVKMLRERFRRRMPSPPAPLPAVEGRNSPSPAAPLPEVEARIIFLPPQPFDAYCRLLCLADVILDPPHFSASSSCYDLFSYNLPVVAWPGELIVGRVTLGCYRKMGVDDLIVHSAEEYVDKAVQVATDRDYRKYVTERIAERSDVLFNDLEAVREHERFFQEALTQVGR